MLSHGVIFNLGSVKIYLSAITETYFSFDKDILITVTDAYVYFLPHSP